MVRKGYFLITLFYLPGFCGEPCIYLSLPPLGSGFWSSVSPLDMHLGSSHHTLPRGLSLSPVPTQHDGNRPHFQPQAKRECCSCPSAMLAKFPWLLSDSRLFPGSLSELQAKPKPLLPGSALFSEELPWRLRMHLLHQDPDSPSIAPSMWGLFHATRDRRYLPNKVSQVTSQHPVSFLQLRLHTTAMQSVPQYTQLTSMLRNLAMTTSGKRLA